MIFRLNFHIQVSSASLALSQKYLIKGFEEKRVNLYHKFMVEIAIIFGAEKEKAERELKESLEFEIKLANVSSNYIDSSSHERTITKQIYLISDRIIIK